MTEDQIRQVAADQMAVGFIVEILLKEYLKSFPPEQRGEIAQTIIKTGERTDAFTNVVKDDFEAEAFADVVVLSHGKVQGYVERALARIAS